MTGEQFILGERLRLEAVLHSGPAAVVHRALDTSCARPVAVKVIRPAGGPGTEVQTNRFLTGARTLQSLKLKCFPPILDFGVMADGSAYLVMDLVQGVGFRTLAGASHTQVAFLLGQVAQALDTLAQAGMFHHNLCPENLLVVATPAGTRAQVLGLGTAALLDPPGRLAASSRSVEALAFAAPELLALREQAPSADSGADLYSLARVACLLLDARVAPGKLGEKQVNLAESVRQELAAVEQLEAALSQALHTDARQRRITAAELAAAFHHATSRARPGTRADAPDAGDERTAPVPLPAQDEPGSGGEPGADELPADARPMPPEPDARMIATAVVPPPPRAPQEAAGAQERTVVLPPRVPPVPPAPPAPEAPPSSSVSLETTVAVPSPAPLPPTPAEDREPGPQHDEPFSPVLPDEQSLERTVAAPIAAPPPAVAGAAAPPVSPPGSLDRTVAVPLPPAPAQGEGHRVDERLRPEEPAAPAAGSAEGDSVPATSHRPAVPGGQNAPLPPVQTSRPAERNSGGTGVPKLKLRVGGRSAPAEGAAATPAATEPELPAPPEVDPVLEPRETFDPNKTNPAIVPETMGKVSQQGGRPPASPGPSPSAASADTPAAEPPSPPPAAKPQAPPPPPSAAAEPPAPPPPPEEEAATSPGEPAPPLPPAGSDRSRGLPRWIWPVVGGAVLLVGTMILAVLLGRPRVSPPRPVSEAPRPEFREEPTFEAAREPDARLLEAEVALMEGDLARAREILTAIAAPDVIAFTPEERASYHAMLEDLEGGTRQQAVDRLRSAIDSGNLGQLRRGVNALAGLDRAELLAEGRDVPDLLAQARRALQFHGRLQQSVRAGDHAAVLERAADLLAVLPRHSDTHAQRDRAARALEERSRAEEAEGRFETAAEFLRVIQRRWPERAGLEAEITRLVQQHELVQGGRRTIAGALETLERRPDEGLRMLGDSTPHAVLQQEHQEAQRRLQDRLRELDAQPPAVTLVDDSDLRLRRNQAAVVRLHVVDDYRVEGVQAWARNEANPQFREITVREAGGNEYRIEFPVQFHGNSTVEFYVVASDVSGNTGSLGTRDQPVELRRRGLFRR